MTTARVLDAWESQHLVDDYLGTLVCDERRATRRVEYFLPGPMLAALNGRDVAELVALLQRIMQLPGVEVTAADRDDPRKAPGWIRVVALPRPIPRITDAPLPGMRPGPTYDDVREFEAATHRAFTFLFPGSRSPW